MTPQKRRKVLYHGLHGGLRQQFCIQQRLDARGLVEPVPDFVTFNDYWEGEIRKKFPTARVVQHPNLLDRLFRAPKSKIEAGSLEEKVFLKAWKSDRILRNKSRAWVEPIWVASVKRLSSFLDETSPDVILSDGIQSLPCFALLFEATKRSIPYIQFWNARLGSRRVEVHADASGWPLGFKRKKEPSPETRGWAEAYLATVRAESYAGPAYMTVFKGKKIRLGRTDLEKGLRLLGELVRGGALELTRGDMLLPFKAKLRAFWLTRSLHDPEIYHGIEAVKAIPGPKVLFPLHVTPEASTMVWATKYCVMGEAVDMISRNLPEGWTLVVKEHPSVTTLQRSTAERDWIRSHRNVVFLSPFVSNRELFQLCDRLLVINSTLGMEAMLEGRPVITLGNPIYDAADNTVPCPQVENLGAALAAAPGKKIDDERSIRFLSAYYDSTGGGYYGNVDIFRGSARDELMSDQNLNALATTLEEKIFMRWDEVQDLLREGVDFGI